MRDLGLPSLGYLGLAARMMAECMPSATVLVGVISTDPKPASRRPVAYSENESAPAMHPTQLPRSRRSSALSSSSATTSLMPMRPPARRTRAISANTVGLSAERLITQFEMTTSTDACVEGDVLDVALAEFDVGRFGLRCVLPCEFEHLVGHVDAVDEAGWADSLGRQEHVDPCSGAEIEDRLALGEFGDGGGVPASKAGGRCSRRNVDQVGGRVEVAPEVPLVAAAVR